MGVQNVYQRYYDTFSNSKALWETGCQEPFIENTYALTSFVPYAIGAVSNAIPVFGFNNADFISRGAMYCVSVAKPQESKITQCTLVIQYNADTNCVGNGLGSNGLAATGNPQILLMSSYKKTVKVTIANSVCVGVEVAEG